MSTSHCASIHELGRWTLVVATLPLAAPAVQALDLAASPQSVVPQLAPNVILTIDDSNTMRRAYAPGRGEGQQEAAAKGEKRYDYSAHFNPLYYDPKTIYVAPNGKPAKFEGAWLNGYDTDRGTMNLENAYRPTGSYSPVKVAGESGHGLWKHPGIDVCKDGCPFEGAFTGSRAYYYVYNDQNQGCDGKDAGQDLPGVTESERKKIDEDCYTHTWVKADEEQNFANWYSYYRTRNLAAVSAVARTFPAQKGKIRLAWQGIGNSAEIDDTSKKFACKDLSGKQCWNADGKQFDNQLRPLDGAHETNFYDWLYRVAAGPLDSAMRTAIIRAGEYFQKKKVYLDDPDAPESDTNPAYACRDNFHIIITDGEWKAADTGVTFPTACKGNVDGCSLSSPTYATAYDPKAPYQDDNKVSLADLALHYWATDLNKDLPNSVFTNIIDKTGDTFWNPKNDPATWQHMVNFVLGTGMSAVLGADWQGDAYSGAYAGFKDGSRAWPKTDTPKGKVYDYWHAALNSRGQFFSVEKTDEMIKALETIVNRIEDRTSAVALAANSTRLDNGTAVYQASFYTKDWHSDLTATKVKADGTTGDQLWKASIPAHGSRNLYTWSGNAGTSFTWDGLSGAQQAALDDAIKGEVNGKIDDAAVAKRVLAYLRGDQSWEQQNGGDYRNRSALLGDIVNSDPVYVAAADYGYSRLTEGAKDGSYKNFVEAKQDRVKMLYVGANDGMLHAFVAGAGQGDGNACGATLGAELFAYVPAALLPDLPKLINPNYKHRYYVDGASYVGDAHLDDGDANTQDWKTILLGVTGAGARAVFALDVTNPCSFGASKVMWEFTGAKDGDLGYTVGQPVIARLNNGKWAAVFGNGYNSDNGHAVLFVVDLKDGTLIKKFDVNQGQGNLDNGLATPALYDANGDGVTDYVYAGDNEGKLWKFRLTDEPDPNDENYVPVPGDVDKWGVAYGGNPLFTARHVDADKNQIVQPITAPLEIGSPPPGQNGVMIYFGTGRFLATGDNVSKKVQSLYGILDSGTAIAATDRSPLQKQEILYEGALGGRGVRATSANPVDYANQRGWYMDLIYNTARGERVVSVPMLRYDRVVFITMIPSDDPCKAGGDSWVMEFSAISGGANEAVFDVDGKAGWDYATFMVGGKEVTWPVSGVKSEVGVIKGVAIITDTVNNQEFKLGTGSEEGKIDSIKEKPGGGATGRVSWREIID